MRRRNRFRRSTAPIRQWGTVPVSEDNEHFEGPDETDADLLEDSDDAEAVMECPSCGEMIHEYSPRCPHCGDWVIAATEAERRNRGWVWPILIVGLILGLILIFSR